MTVGEHDALAKTFEGHRTHLRAVALRMLGSQSEAEDAVQEAWLRLSRSDRSGIDNFGGWLTTVVARVCLDMLRSRKSRGEQSLDADASEGADLASEGLGPDREVLLADAIGPALLVVLETLEPAERLAFVLHDMFGIPFEEIAEIVGRSSDAARQLASRARRRVQGAATPDAGRERRREVVSAFLTAARGGDFNALLAVLDPNVVVSADDAAARLGSTKEIRGAEPVAGFFAGRARGARRAVVNGVAGATWAPNGKPKVVFDFTIEDGKIVALHLIADESTISKLDLVILEDEAALRS